MESQASNIINETEVAQYLENHPDFFSSNIGLLATMYLPNPHGSGTVSLVERQQAAQRDKIRQIERKYNELLEFGIENDAKSNKVHKLTLALLSASTLSEVTQALNDSLLNDFDISTTKVMIWAEPKNTNDAIHLAFEETNSATKSWAESLNEPYCGPLLNESISAINLNSEAKSYAIAPLGNGAVFGLLVMASTDEKRFYPEMGTLFVKRIGELVSAALRIYLV